MKLGVYNKSFAALYAGALIWGGQVVTSAPSRITASEWLALVGVPVVAGVVRQIPNAPKPPPG